MQLQARVLNVQSFRRGSIHDRFNSTGGAGTPAAGASPYMPASWGKAAAVPSLTGGGTWGGVAALPSHTGDGTWAKAGEVPSPAGAASWGGAAAVPEVDGGQWASFDEPNPPPPAALALAPSLAPPPAAPSFAAPPPAALPHALFSGSAGGSGIVSVPATLPPVVALHGPGATEVAPTAAAATGNPFAGMFCTQHYLIAAQCILAS